MPTAPVTQQLRQLRRRYLIALSLIAVLVIGSQIAIQLVIADKVGDPQSLATAQWIGWGFMILMLIALAVEAFLILKPASPVAHHVAAKIAENEQNLKQLFDDSPLAMVMVDAESLRILHMNQRTLDLTQFDTAKLDQQPLAVLLSDTHAANRIFLDKVENKTPLNEFDVVLLNTQSGETECLVTPRTIHFSGRPTYLMGFTNLSDLSRSRENTEYYATFDELTGLVNRRTGMMLLEKAMARSWRDQHPLSIIYANLDGLKLANERYGKSEGDDLLRAASTIMTGLIRSSDFAVRLGGDDFMMILPSCPPQNAQHIVENMARLLKSVKIDSTRQFVYSVSTGMATFSEDRHTSPDELLKEARDNMASGTEAKQLH